MKSRKKKHNAGVLNVKTPRITKFLKFISDNPDRTIRAFDLRRLDRQSRPALKQKEGQICYEVVQSVIN